jgi:hypothetical protein
VIGTERLAFEPGGKIPPTVLAAITFTQILELLLLIVIVHVVLLAPIVVAIFRTYLEYQENQALRRQRATTTRPG